LSHHLLARLDGREITPHDAHVDARRARLVRDRLELRAGAGAERELVPASSKSERQRAADAPTRAGHHDRTVHGVPPHGRGFSPRRERATIANTIRSAAV